MPLTSSLTKPLAPSWANRFKEQSLERGRRYALENPFIFSELSGQKTEKNKYDLEERTAKFGENVIVFARTLNPDAVKTTY